MYSYGNGFNNKAIIALLVGILPNVPGFLTTIGVAGKDAFWPWLSQIYNYAWFAGFFISGISYIILMKNSSSLISQTRKDYDEKKLRGLEVNIEG